jgi:hypothetical protein
MDFPTRIRSEFIVASPEDRPGEDICQRVARWLISKGAIITEVADNTVQFRVEGAVLNINPLSQCRKGSFKVESVPTGVKVSYDLDVINIVQRVCFSMFLTVPIILVALFVALFQRSYIMLSLLLMAYLVSVPGTYFVCSWQAKFPFRRVALNG